MKIDIKPIIENFEEECSTGDLRIKGVGCFIVDIDYVEEYLVKQLESVTCDCPDFEITTDHPPSIIRYKGFTFKNVLVPVEVIALKVLKAWYKTLPDDQLLADDIGRFEDYLEGKIEGGPQ